MIAHPGELLTAEPPLFSSGSSGSRMNEGASKAFQLLFFKSLSNRVRED